MFLRFAFLVFAIDLHLLKFSSADFNTSDHESENEVDGSFFPELRIIMDGEEVANPETVGAMPWPFPNQSLVYIPEVYKAPNTTLPDGFFINVQFTAQCVNHPCDGNFTITSGFRFTTPNGNAHKYMCDDILRVPLGHNSYAKGLRLSTLLWRMLLDNDPTKLESTVKSIQCKAPTNPNHQGAHDLCECYGQGSNEICRQRLESKGPGYASCIKTERTRRCYQLLCKRRDKSFISRLDDVDHEEDSEFRVAEADDLDRGHSYL